MKVKQLIDELNALLSSEGDINVVVGGNTSNRNIEEVCTEKCSCGNKIAVIELEDE